MQKKDDEQILREFRSCQHRQFFAIAVTLVLILLFSLLNKRPDLFGELSKNSTFAAQVIVIAAFIGFSSQNWRCPSCKKYMGSDINRRICKHCGTRLR
jgi:hypothetical protein